MSTLTFARSGGALSSMLLGTIAFWAAATQEGKLLSTAS